MANTSKCPLHRLTKLTPRKWKSSELIKIEQAAKKCTHPHQPLKEVTLNARNEFGRFCTTTPLMIATEQGDLEMVKQIVEVWEVDVSAAVDKKYAVKAKSWEQPKIFEKITPLFVAALHHHYDIVHYLVENGADVSARTSKKCGSSFGGLTPLHAAFILGHQNATSEQLERIIRLLVFSGADPSALSSTGIPVWMIGGFANYKFTCEDDVRGDLCYHPEAIHLLIELGMSVTQELPLGRNAFHVIESPYIIERCGTCFKQEFLLGRTAFHLMAGEHHIDNVEVIVQLLLEKGVDLQARDSDGLSPIMVAAIGDNKVPNITFLQYLLKRKEISNKDKIDALEVAAAVLLSSSYWDTHREAFSLFLAQAQDLRIEEKCILVPETPRNGRSAEWITSSTGDVIIAERERQLQSILIRMRIYSGMSWGALRVHLWPYIYDQYINEYYRFRTYPGPVNSQLLDIFWTMLETIHRFIEKKKGSVQREEEGIWLATVQVVVTLARTLMDHFGYSSRIIPTEILETSLDLALTTFKPLSCLNEIQQKEFKGYVRAFNGLFTLAVRVPDLLLRVLSNNDDNINNTVRFIESRNDKDICGSYLILEACRDLSAEYLFDVIDLLLKYGADPHKSDDYGGVLHSLAQREWKSSMEEQGIGATARLFLKNGVCLHLVSRNWFFQGTAADWFWKDRDREANVLPDWLKEGVPKLLCQSAKVIQRNKIPYKSSPITLHAFVESHYNNTETYKY